MKTIKKISAVMMAAMLTIVMGITAFAAPGPIISEGEYSITVTNNKETSNVTIAGQEYSAYKIFDVDYADGATGPHHYDVDVDFSDFEYVLNETTKYKGQELIDYVASLDSNSAALDDFAKQAYAYISNKHIPADGIATAQEETATITVKKPGYYLVYGAGKTEDGKVITAACALDTTNPNAVVNVKIQAPTLDKVIVNADSNNGGDGKGTAVNVGDKVDFKVTSKVPNMTGYTKYDYIVHDTMSTGLTFNDDVKVVIGGKQLKVVEDYTKTVATDETFYIEMDLVALQNKYPNEVKPGAEIVITYSATLNKNALNTKEETNTVYLEYSNNPNEDTKTKTPEKKVYIYDFDIVIDKFESNKEDTTKKLAGAEFILYRKAKDGSNEYYKLDNDKVTWIKDEANSTSVLTDNNGVASFKGLDSGTYYLREIKAPAGYNPLKTDIKVVITANYNKDGTVSSSATAKYGEKEDAKPLAETNGETPQIDYTVPVPNTTGVELPSTGGVGTNIFYIIGGLLMAGAVVILITRKKMS